MTNTVELANDYVNCYEEEFTIGKWKEWAVYNLMAEQSCNPEEQACADETMDELTEELLRTSPDGDRALDHEEVWRHTGEYIVYSGKI